MLCGPKFCMVLCLSFRHSDDSCRHANTDTLKILNQIIVIAQPLTFIMHVKIKQVYLFVNKFKSIIIFKIQCFPKVE